MMSVGNPRLRRRVSTTIRHAGIAGLGTGNAVRRTAKLSRRMIDVTIITGMADFNQSDLPGYVRYRFVLDAADTIVDSDRTDEAAVDLAKLLKQRAIGVWRPEEFDGVLEAQFESLAHAAEVLLIANDFDVEWIDGYTIYCRKV